MQTADECRKLASASREKSKAAGLSPKMAGVLRNIAKTFTTLTKQYELLSAISIQEQAGTRH